MNKKELKCSADIKLLKLENDMIRKELIKFQNKYISLLPYVNQNKQKEQFTCELIQFIKDNLVNDNRAVITDKAMIIMKQIIKSKNTNTDEKLLQLNKKIDFYWDKWEAEELKIKRQLSKLYNK